MTPREPGQDFDPKHRIIGAVVVVALAVIFIPMILSHREPPAGRPAPPSAPPEESAAQDKVAIVPVSPPATAEAPKEAAKPAEAAPARGEIPRAPASKSRDTEPAPPPPAPAKTSGTATAAKHVSRGWIVQVGTFSDAANAARLERKLRAAHQPLLVERIRLHGARAVRVRVGPFPDRAAALAARKHLRERIGVTGVVLTYP